MLSLIKSAYSNMFNLRSIVRFQTLKVELESRILGKDSKSCFSEEADIIVSLTTYKKRIFDVHLVIESILRQTVVPKKIVLWLDKDEYSHDSLPAFIKIQQRKYGLIVNFCSNLRSYKKLVPTIKLYNHDKPIITIDDDVIYPPYFIERLVSNHSKYTDEVLCYRSHKIKYDLHENIKPYKEWEHNIKEPLSGFDIMPTGVGGVLYPPDCFHSDICNENIFMELAPNADDFWFKIMSVLNNVKSRNINDSNFNDDFTIIKESQDIALYNDNVTQNDIQLHNLLRHYKLKIK